MIFCMNRVIQARHAHTYYFIFCSCNACLPVNFLYNNYTSQTSLSRTHHGDHQRDSIAAPPPSFPGFTRRRRTGRMHDTLMTLRMSGASFDEGADVESGEYSLVMQDVLPKF